MNFLHLFRRDKSESTLEELPADVLASIEEASITMRHSGDYPRAMVQLPGFTPFIHSEDITPVRLAQVFPGLTPAQVRRASRYVHSQVIRTCRQLSVPLKPQDTARQLNWAARW